MEFSKWHGLGNDFVVVDARKDGLPDDAPALARAVCDRHFGIGADGLVFILQTAEADIEMRIFNSDGSEAEMCGNAIRCVARYVYDEGTVGGTVVRVKTLAGIMVPQVILEDGAVTKVRVDMGVPRLDRTEIPMLGEPGRVVNEPLTVNGRSFNITVVSMGNPHCVVFVPDLEEVDLLQVGPIIEKHHLFPRKTNVEFVEVLSPDAVRVKVWERGAGQTMACGTGACAVAVAGVLNGLTRRSVCVELPGGSLDIAWEEDGHVYMTGPAVKVFEGRYFGSQ